ncbi:MAG: tRNA 2-thiouridine(34) synthase MnmA [Planctomycetota bacterium]|nr:tRNA 2-thiouridine(34) synthase MnmA [Planctomycetota bacterium]
MNAHNPSRKVLLAMSGGVDSSVAAVLLQEAGWDVIGCFMRLGSPGESLAQADESCDTSKIRIGHQGCCSINDAEDARTVAARLGIPFYVLNFREDFGRIIDYFQAEYHAGRTPNPCVRCNDWLKFGKLHDYAHQVGASHVASGHYARLIGEGDDLRICRGVDEGKDQSYVLFGATPDRLREMLLPIGDLKKDRVREIARDHDLPVFDKPDSQEICFVPDNDYAGLLRRTDPEKMQSGEIVNTSGEIVGQHEGHQHFTIGQRRGLGVAAGTPLYVIHRDAQANRVVIGDRDDLSAPGLVADQANWFVNPPETWIPCRAQIRYNASAVPARVMATSSSQFVVEFATSQFAVAPGQAVVCYDGDVVIGGGWIREALPPDAEVLGSEDRQSSCQ